MYSPHVEVTHHITSEYIADLSCSASLVSLCQFVKPEWLHEVLRLGNIPTKNEQSNGVSLEDHFALPQESKYRPSFSPSLSPWQRKLGVWEPNEERVNLFKSCRFICLHEKVTVTDKELREVIHRGNGILENFDIHSGIQKFGRALSRSQAKEGKKTIIVGDLDSMQLAVGKETWEEFLTQAQRHVFFFFVHRQILDPFDCTRSTIPVLPFTKIIQAVLEARSDVLFEALDLDNISGLYNNDGVTLLLTLSCSLVVQSPLPKVVPSSTSEESSVPQMTETSTRPPLVRRATSRAASRDPSEGPTLTEGDNQESIVPRRVQLAVRRVFFFLTETLL